MKRNLILITALSAALALPSLAQNTDPFAGGGGGNSNADPFGTGGDKPTRRVVLPNAQAAQQTNNIRIRYEAFSLDLATAASLMREGTTDASLYNTMIEMLDTKKAVQEALTVITSRSGQLSKNQAITETIYPTEWDPAELPSSIGVKIDAPKDAQGKSTGASPDVDALDDAQKLDDLPRFITPANPTAFETRNIGTSVEVEAMVGADGTIDLVMAPEHVALAGTVEWGQGVSRVPMPEFETQSLTTQTQVLPGVPRLLGTINRSQVSKIDPQAKTRIWFAFVTATPVK